VLPSDTTEMRVDSATKDTGDDHGAVALSVVSERVWMPEATMIWGWT